VKLRLPGRFEWKILGAMFIGEQITTMAAIGAALSIAGVAGVTLVTHPRNPAAVPAP